MRKLAIACGIHAIETGSDDRERRAAGFDRASVRGRWKQGLERTARSAHDAVGVAECPQQRDKVALRQTLERQCRPGVAASIERHGKARALAKRAMPLRMSLRRAPVVPYADRIARIDDETVGDVIEHPKHEQ